jgi:protocatechuate 4,5-dioxygenase, beta chain
LHLAEFLVREEDFDLTVCQELAVDHGIYSWLPYVIDLPWSVPITPIAVNMIRQPLPTSGRLCQLGTAVRRAVIAFDSDERVLIVATGGMSHQISGARFGIANEDLDRYFLRTLPRGLKELVAIPQEDYMRYGRYGFGRTRAVVRDACRPVG